MSLEDNNPYNANLQPDDRAHWLMIEVYTKANHPELLAGLDQWLELGLISHLQVLKICRQNLSCNLPELSIVNQPDMDITQESKSSESALIIAPAKPNFISRIWQGFLDELSIRWLLFLGIFLVIVSSGVLAASQWNNFPGLGQYLILLVYTLAFWGISIWSNKQNNLKLTAQTLNAIAILLIPINCWAISHFSLGNSILEWITLIIALILLISISYSCFQLTKSSNKWLIASLFILFSFLHLIWSFIPSPLITIYAGIALLSWIHLQFLLPKAKYPVFDLLCLLLAWSLLLIRVLLSKEYLILDCTLAIAIFGWIIASIYLNQEKKAQNITADQPSEIEQLTNTFFSKVLQTISIIIFAVTWLISILGGIFESQLFFAQTVAISALTVHLFSQRLTLYWRKRDLTAIFIIGLQTVFIAKELIPNSIRSNALDLAVNLSRTEYLPESVFGVTLFPYLILFIWIASWLYQQQKSELAQYTEILTLLLGIGLTSLSLANPTWRSLNLLLSTLTLGYVAWIRQPLRIPLVYSAHFLGLITVINGIDVILPNLSQPLWGSILVSLMTLEWLISSHQKRKAKQTFSATFNQSCWYVGIFLAVNSYICFLSSITNPDSSPIITYAWGLVWLMAPGMLTWIAQSTRSIHQRRMATTLSCLSLILIQMLTYGHPITRFISLGVSIGLIYFNAFNVRRIWITIVHLGFGLSLIVSIAYSFISQEYWLIISGIFILGLKQFRNLCQAMADAPKFDYISQRTAFGILGVGMEAKNYKLINKYIQAADFWAIALITFNLIILSVAYLNIGNLISYPQDLLTAILVLSGVIWHYWQKPNHLVLLAIAWLIELLIIGIVAFMGGQNFSFALTNIILGLLTWIILPQVIQRNSSWARLNLSYVAIIYVALAILWRLFIFNTYTGLITISAAFILLNVSLSNHQINRFTNYLGFMGISLGIYELVIYRMQQSSAGSLADGLTILALVAAAIAFGYRVSAWWYRQRQHKTLFHLSLGKIILVAHLHWAISSILKIIAASIAIESTTPRLTPISLATSFFLGIYALIQGKDQDPHASTKANNANDWWVYVGLVEIIATLVYSRLIISKLSFFDPWRVIFTCAIALLIYQIPWHNFGWRVTPWQRAALITPALMALVTAEDISYLSLFFTAAFYLRIAYVQKNLRWSYISLGFINWALIRLVWQFNTEFIWLATVISLSILYVAQFDPYFITQRKPRHYLRIIGCSILCIGAFFYQDPGIIPTIVSFCFIFLGLGLKIRAFLFSGTITLVLTVIYQLITLVIAYAFLKWVVGLLAGIFSILIAAGFEKKRDHIQHQLNNYNRKLHDWQ